MEREKEKEREKTEKEARTAMAAMEQVEQAEPMEDREQVALEEELVLVEMAEVLEAELAAWRVHRVVVETEPMAQTEVLEAMAQMAATQSRQLTRTTRNSRSSSLCFKGLNVLRRKLE